MKIITNKNYELKENLINDLENKVKICERKLLNIEEDYKIILKRKDLECENKILEVVEDKINRIARLELENGILKKEVEILTKSFENMGFDIKDMKNILDKLVDGIVSKNTINVIK